MFFREAGLQIEHLVSSVSLAHLEIILYYTLMDMGHMPKWLLKSFIGKEDRFFFQLSQSTSYLERMDLAMEIIFSTLLSSFYVVD